ncbi:MAG: aminopeptidase P N-terminal domain-containing protein [Bacteroidetes bacterium]|nr:aminopeptidase P N-terminal domain-containing protein [Bacteroidota bacterium]
MRPSATLRRLLAAGAMAWILAGCKESTVGPASGSFPTKLYPYEVTYDAAVFKQRRDALVRDIPAGSIALLTTNNVYLRNGDIDYEFRPASEFYYMTGFDEPHAVAILRPKQASPGSSEMIMFVEDRQGTLVQWLGPVHGPEGAVQFFGADSAFEFASLQPYLRAMLQAGGASSVYANLDDNEEVRETFVLAAGAAYPVRDVDTLISALRPVKVPLEIAHLRRAIEVSSQAFLEGIRSVRPGVYEYEIEAVMEFVLGLNGCPGPSFPTIVASGPNITTIHYIANTRQMQAGDLVMIDFGAEYGYYAADLTRTLPVSGAFNAAQAAIYDIVKTAHDSVIAIAAPGVNFNSLTSLSTELLIEGLLQRGVISGSKGSIISSGQYRLYIPAGMGHQIGLDVHDPWPMDASGNRVLRENMVLAIEPHLYLNAGDLTVAPAYRGVCARIEDDILITSSGCEVLSAALPNTRAALEQLMIR